jgi:hypothetical protein
MGCGSSKPRGGFNLYYRLAFMAGGGFEIATTVIPSHKSHSHSVDTLSVLRLPGDSAADPFQDRIMRQHQCQSRKQNCWTPQAARGEQR